MSGSATFTIVTSMSSMNVPRQTVNSGNHLRIGDAPLDGRRARRPGDHYRAGSDTGTPIRLSAHPSATIRRHAAGIRRRSTCSRAGSSVACSSPRECRSAPSPPCSGSRSRPWRGATAASSGRHPAGDRGREPGGPGAEQLVRPHAVQAQRRRGAGQGPGPARRHQLGDAGVGRRGDRVRAAGPHRRGRATTCSSSGCRAPHPCWASPRRWCCTGSSAAGRTPLDDWAALADLLTPDQERRCSSAPTSRSSPPADPGVVEPGDLALLDVLTGDGRASFAAVAQQAGVSESARDAPAEGAVRRGRRLPRRRHLDRGARVPVGGHAVAHGDPGRTRPRGARARRRTRDRLRRGDHRPGQPGRVGRVPRHRGAVPLRHRQGRRDRRGAVDGDQRRCCGT